MLSLICFDSDEVTKTYLIVFSLIWSMRAAGLECNGIFAGSSGVVLKLVSFDLVIFSISFVFSIFALVILSYFFFISMIWAFSLLISSKFSSLLFIFSFSLFSSASASDSSIPSSPSEIIYLGGIWDYAELLRDKLT